jgi:hypothetical protein
LADLVGRVDWDRLIESPVGDSLRREPESVEAATSAMPPAIRIWRRTRATSSLTSPSELLSTSTHRVSPSAEIGNAEVATRLPATCSTPEATCPSSIARSAC